MPKPASRHRKYAPGPHFRFGRILKELRKARTAANTTRPLRQHHLATRLGTTVMAISNWETGTFLPDLERLDKLRGCLNLSGAEFATLLAAYEQEKREQALGEKFSAELKSAITKRLVGSSDKPSKCPLYGVRNLLHPQDALKNLEKWRGGFIELPGALAGREVFAFRMDKDAPQVAVKAGDVIFCDAVAVASINDLVVFPSKKRLFLGQVRLTKNHPVLVSMMAGTRPKARPTSDSKWWCKAVLVVRNLEEHKR